MSGPGRAFAVVGPSGAGKDTLIDAARAARPDLQVIRRVITRPEALGGEDFEGVSEVEFDRRLAAGEFALDWQAHGLRYGLPRSAAQAQAAGRDILFNASRAALPLAARRFAPLVIILVTAPVAVLAERLVTRGRESRNDIAARLKRAGFALPDGLPGDVPVRIVQNDASVSAGAARFLAALQPAPVRG
jgi:phosphonate metabolism protein PhnN/1,5-bisphosphokinase (PRPP-forming)